MADDNKGKYVPTMQKLYRPSDVMKATGISRGQFCNRALMLGIKRDRGYTIDEVYKIVSYAPINRTQKADVEKLRGLLSDMLKENGSPLRIQTDKDGNAQLVY